MNYNRRNRVTFPAEILKIKDIAGVGELVPKWV